MKVEIRSNRMCIKFGIALYHPVLMNQRRNMELAEDQHNSLVNVWTIEFAY